MALVVQNPSDVLALSLAQRPLNSFIEQGGVAPDRSQWCAKLVADHVHVSPFRIVRFLRGAPRRIRFDARAVALLERRFGGCERFGQRFGFRLQRLLGPNQLLLGPLPRNEDAVGGPARDVLKVLLLVVAQISCPRA